MAPDELAGWSSSPVSRLPAVRAVLLTGRLQPLPDLAYDERMHVRTSKEPGSPEAIVEQFNQRGAGHLPGLLGIVITHIDRTEVRSELLVKKPLMAPNGYLHAGTVVTLADTSSGYGCIFNLPEGATGFTTIELKSNHLGTAREGTVLCRATPVHLGKTTQVWDAVVTHKESGKTIAIFRCTQLVIYPKEL